jgi:hypothetical protein
MVTRLNGPLKPNEFAYKLETCCDLDAWKNRVKDVKLPPISPMSNDLLAAKETLIGKSLGELTIDRMSR